MEYFGFFARKLALPKAPVGRAERRPSVPCAGLSESVGKAAYESWLRTCGGPEPVPKKDQRRNPPAPPAGARVPRAGTSLGAPPPAPARSCPLPRLPALAAAFRTCGVQARSGLQVLANHPPTTRRSGGVAWRKGGFKSPCLTDLTGLQIPPCRLVPAARFRALGWHAALPWIRRRLG